MRAEGSKRSEEEEQRASRVECRLPGVGVALAPPVPAVTMNHSHRIMVSHLADTREVGT